MSQKLNSFSGIPFLDANGDPYSGAQLFVYEAGTSTKYTVTKDLAGASNHANPIILNSSGVVADGAGAAQAIWQAEGQAIKFVLAPSTDTDPPVAAIRTFDNLQGINDATITQSQWETGPTPTYVSATSFTLVGDQSLVFHVGRRVKSTNSGGTIYSTISAVAYTSLTTVTVVNDTGTLDSGMSSTEYGLITAVGSSISAEAAVAIQGPDIASATALPYPAYGTTSDVTGTTTITSFATSGILGTVVYRQFDGALTLTHHATDLILPGAANITTAAGDIGVFWEYAADDWRCISYSRASGGPIALLPGSVDTPELATDAVTTVKVTDANITRAKLAAPPPWVLIATWTPTAVATHKFTMDESLYSGMKIVLDNVIPATDSVSLLARLGHTDGGTIISSANYDYDERRPGAATLAGTLNDSSFPLGNVIGTVAGEGISGHLETTGLASTKSAKGIISYMVFTDAGGTGGMAETIGFCDASLTTAFDTVQLLWSSGNFEATGEIRAYALAKA